MKSSPIHISRAAASLDYVVQGASTPRAAPQRFLFPSFFSGGFECSTHVLKSGRRLDLVAATRHAEFAEQDYARLVEQGILTAREGLRWHLIEHRSGEYDFSSVMPIIAAARHAGVKVLWDLLHFGWPDGLDIFRPE